MMKRRAEAAKAVWTLKALQRKPTMRLETKSPTALTAASVPNAMPCWSLGTSSADRGCSSASSVPTERRRQCFEAEQKRPLGLRRGRTLANEKPEGRNRDETWQERPKKNFAVRMAGGFEKPERGERAGDGAYRVHQAFETEGAAVGVGRNVGGEECFFGRRANAAAEPRGSATE